MTKRSYFYNINNHKVDLTVTYTKINGKTVGIFTGHAPSTGFMPNDLLDLWKVHSKSICFTKYTIMMIDDNITREKTSVEPIDKAKYIAEESGDFCMTSALNISKHRIPNIFKNPQAPIKALHDTSDESKFPFDSDGMTIIVSKSLYSDLKIDRMDELVDNNYSAPFYYSFNGQTVFCGNKEGEKVKAFSNDGRICADHSILTVTFYTNPQKTTFKDFAVTSGAELRGTGIKCEKKYVEDVLIENPRFDQYARDFTDYLFDNVNTLFEKSYFLLDRVHKPFEFTKKEQKRIKLLNLANPKSDADFTKEDIDFLCSSEDFKQYLIEFLDKMLELQEKYIEILFHFDEKLKEKILTQLRKKYIKKMMDYILGETRRWDKLFTYNMMDCQKNGGFDIEETSPYYTEYSFIQRIKDITPISGALFMCEAQYGSIWKKQLSNIGIYTDCISEDDENASMFTRNSLTDYTKLNGLGSPDIAQPVKELFKIGFIVLGVYLCRNYITDYTKLTGLRQILY